MRKLAWFLIVVVILVLISVVFAQKSIKMLKDGSQAYLYGYSLVLMDTTRQVTTGTNNGQTPINHFTHIRVFPDHQFRMDRGILWWRGPIGKARFRKA